MKITKSYLKQIIREEIEKTNEGFFSFFDREEQPSKNPSISYENAIKILVNYGERELAMDLADFKKKYGQEVGDLEIRGNTLTFQNVGNINSPKSFRDPLVPSRGDITGMPINGRIFAEFDPELPRHSDLVRALRGFAS